MREAEGNSTHTGPGHRKVDARSARFPLDRVGAASLIWAVALFSIAMGLVWILR